MRKNDIDNLFKKPEGSFDVEKSPEGHANRFLDKLNNSVTASEDIVETKTQKSVIQLYWKQVVSVAAIAILFVSIGSFLFPEEVTSADLASVSPEMEQTQSFFVSTLSEELQTLKSLDSPDAKFLVDDALKQIEILEIQYEDLKTDLVESGNDKRVIYAMITNFQNRIELLQEVIIKIEEIKDLNTTQNENII